MRQLSSPVELGDVVFSEAEIAAAVARLAQAIRARNALRPLVAVGILKGALVFTADLIRALGD
ncbi:MAG TPA: hypothetical protein VEJ41_08355, partial [Candidatus Acidoferrales bacterium]|nr:hypothetical protein [Candidatus Acidoferrales bacterium]